MDQLLNYLLTQILVHGYPIIFFAILVAYLGAPIPLNVLILAAGAFTIDGTLNLYYLIPFVALTAWLGDIFNYYLGKRFGFLLINSYTKKWVLLRKDWRLWMYF
jgi:membrane protein DedA with SNARE-associated domain